jgi:hypothetical protein
MVEEILGRLPELSGSQLGRLEDEIRRERQRRASSDGTGCFPRPRGYRAAPHGSAGVPPPRGRVSAAGATPLHPSRRLGMRAWTLLVLPVPRGGKRRKLYLGKTNDPQSTLAAKRAKRSGE